MPSYIEPYCLTRMLHIVNSFLFMNTILLYSTICASMYLLLDSWAISNFSYYEWSCYGHPVTNHFVDICFHFSGANTRNGVALSHKHTFKFIRNWQIFQSCCSTLCSYYSCDTCWPSCMCIIYINVCTV